MHRKSILLSALLAAFIVSIVALSPRSRVAVASVSCVITTYDAVSDFSPTSNPNGPWSYGWEPSLGGAFTLFTSERTVYEGLDTWEGPEGMFEFNFPLVSRNHTGATLNYASGVSQPANMLNMTPSFSDKLSVIRWTAPTTGAFSVAGLFQGIDTRNTTTDVHIRRNGTIALFDGNINGFGDQAPFNLVRNLAAGDTLDFAVGFGPDGFFTDQTGLAVTITTAPIIINIADGDVAGLIAAINSANASQCPTTINLAQNGTYTLTAIADHGLGESGAPGPAGLPYIRSPLTINGNGSTIQRSTATGTPDFLIFAVSSANSGVHHAYNANLTLNGVTLTGATLGALGITHGVAVVQNSTITQNLGGGIKDFCGKLTLLNSTVSYNTTGFVGGGIYLSSPCLRSDGNDPALAYIAFSTIFENQSAEGINAAGQPYGPGYAIFDEFGEPGDVVIKNSILASPTRAFFPASAYSGGVPPTSLGHNICGDGSCGLTGPGDMGNTNPLLGPLANNGGPTPTHLPLCNSPAINGVPVADSTDVFSVPITTDQRGVSRPQGAGSDIGAVEVSRGQTVTVLGTTGPWNQSLNPSFDYGANAHDNTAPVVIDASSGITFTPGNTIMVTYLSGGVQAGGGYPFNDANGLPGYVRNYCENFGCFPAYFMNPNAGLLAMTMVGTFATNGVIVGNPFPIGNGPKILTIPIGANQLLLGINDTRFADNSGSFTVRINDTNNADAPTVSCPSPVAASADSNCQARVPDVLSGVTASGGCGGTVTLSQSPAAGTIVGLGTTTITVTATDASNNSAYCTTAFTVTDNTPPNVSCPSPSTVPADSNCQAHVPNVLADVTASDCDGPVTLSQSPAAGTLVGLGMTTITVTATDAANNSSTCSTTFTVIDNTPPTITCPANIVSSTEPATCGAVVNYTVTASDNCSAVTVTSNPPSGTTFPKGTTTVNVTARDAAGNTSTCSFTVTIQDHEPPSIVCPANITTLTDPGQCTAVVSYAPAVSDNCAGASVACTPPSGATFPTGTTGVNCIATDAAGNTATCGFSVTVNNQSPVASINSPASGAIYPVGTTVNFAGSFTDNAGDMHTAQWSFVSNTQNITQAGSVNESTGGVSASYTFTSAGVYLVTLTIADQCGHTSTANVISPDGLTAMVVIYDPDGGFVTGGGWIDSPAGAYTPNPALTGRASFGFVSKYQRGATVPTGNTEFQFRVANFNFHSSVYEWLVVAGARAQYKGSGTVNGAGNYGFMLTAIDSQVNGGGGEDKFRIKIWDKNNGNTIVYDNLLNAPDSADPTTVLGGGSIVIQR